MSYDIAWNRRRLEWRKQPQDAPWLIEAILCERTLIEGKPALPRRRSPQTLKCGDNHSHRLLSASCP
jgi:hypothetical protein